MVLLLPVARSRPSLPLSFRCIVAPRSQPLLCCSCRGRRTLLASDGGWPSLCCVVLLQKERLSPCCCPLQPTPVQTLSPWTQLPAPVLDDDGLAPSLLVGVS